MIRSSFFLISAFALTGLFAKEQKKEDVGGPVYGPVNVYEIEKGVYSAKLDITYWVGKPQGVAFSSVASSTGNTKIPISVSRARPGFKLELGFGLPQIKADLGLEYLFFYNMGAKDKYGFFHAVGDEYYGAGYESVGGSVASDFNSFSAFMKKKYIFDQGISLEPLGGMIYAYSQQYLTKVFGNPVFGVISAQIVRASSRINMFGPMGGFNVRFYAPNSLVKQYRFGLLIDSGAALCYNISSTNQKTFVDEEQINRLFRRDKDLVPMLKGSLGLITEYFVKGDHPWSIAGVLKWDTQAWLNFLYLQPNETTASPYTFTMQGLSVGMEGTF